MTSLVYYYYATRPCACWHNISNVPLYLYLYLGRDNITFYIATLEQIDIVHNYTTGTTFQYI